jgi:hypothetical protein
VEAGILRRAERDGGGWVGFGTQNKRAWVKGGRLTVKSGLRHGMAALFGRTHAPRVQEFCNLTWLGVSGIPAARPLVAGHMLGRLGRPVFQFLATAEVPDAQDLAAVLGRDELSTAGRIQLVGDAGALAARMHLAGFEHRDYFARNILRSQRGQLTILDAWSGGPTSSARFSMRDVAGFLGDAEPLLRQGEADAFLQSYAGQVKGAIELPARGEIDRSSSKVAKRLAAKSLLRRRESARYSS